MAHTDAEPPHTHTHWQRPAVHYSSRSFKCSKSDSVAMATSPRHQGGSARERREKKLK